MKKARFILVFALLLLTLAACQNQDESEATEVPQVEEPTEASSVEAVTATPTQPVQETAEPESPADEPTPESEDSESPAVSVTAVPFDLGETFLEQTWEDNEDLRNMPVHLEGMIAAPPTGDNLPVAVFIHGSHDVGCLSDEQGLVQEWPCPETEKHHYEGFAYLLEALAEQGYVAMSIDANPAYVSAYGDPAGAANKRLVVLYDLYLAQIAAAANGESVDFGVDLAGRVDLNQLVVLGHSQGGEGVFHIVEDRADHTTTEQVNAGQGTVSAAILLAPAKILVTDGDLAAPFAVILPACDQDLSRLPGQAYYDDAQKAEVRDDLALSVFLRFANHNRFNTSLEDERVDRTSAICEGALVPAADLQSFLAQFVGQFFDAELGRADSNPTALGMDASQPAPDTILDLSALTSLALPTNQRLVLPLGEEEAVGTATAVYCEQAFVADEEKREPCGRDQFNQPGNPEEIAITWDGPGGAYEVAVPADRNDLSDYEILHLRTALNPVSKLNAAGEPQSFSVQLTDGAGETAVVTLVDEPALAFPDGVMGFDDFYELDTWDNHIIVSSVRLPMSAFSGIDLTDVQTISMVFDATDSGAIFLTDLEFLDVE